MYIILGALLALGGGVITHHIQMNYTKEKEEGALLFDISKSLLEIGGIESQLAKIDSKSEKLDDLARASSLRAQRFEHIERLHLFAIRITLNSNIRVAVRITKFALDEQFRTETNRNALLKEVQESLNSKLLNTYMKEIEREPEKF